MITASPTPTSLATVHPVSSPETEGAGGDGCWVWSDGHGMGRNAFALFRRVLELGDRPTSAVLRLSADSRWRLRIGGEVVAYGSGRFVPAHPQYDTIDLAPWLRPGLNVLVVEVCSFNAACFQSLPGSSGGFIAWGEVVAGGERSDLATPGAWRVRRATAWDPESPMFSFAQGPVEMLDLGALPESWYSLPDAGGWSAPVPRPEGPWRTLTPRRTPPLSHRLMGFARLALIAELDGSEHRIGCRRVVLGNLERSRQQPPPPQLRFPLALAIRSPREQQIELGSFWGEHWLNGVPVKTVIDPVRHIRYSATVALRAGDNLLYIESPMFSEVWSHYLTLPRAAGLELGPLRVGPVLPEGELAAHRGAVPAAPGDVGRLPFRWEEIPGAAVGPSPGRDLALDRPARIIARDAAAVFPLVLGERPADTPGWVVIADCGGQYNGHVRIDLEAPAGTVVDICHDERRRPDGMVATYHANQFIEATERVAFAGGRRWVELFHPRGGRFVQFCIRPPAAGKVTVHGLAVREHCVRVAHDGEFACSDPTFDWTWRTSHASLQAVVEDVLMADSWRERGVYVADHLVESAVFMAHSRDCSPAKRALELFVQARFPDGRFPFCVPAWSFPGDISSNLHFVRMLHQFWSADGDLADAARWWHLVEEAVGGCGQAATVDGLWDVTVATTAERAHGGRQPQVFVDWGAVQGDCSGQANAVLNAWRHHALVCAVDLARALGRGEDADRLAGEASALAAAFRRRLWIPEEGRFARRMVDGRAERQGRALHANALALCYGLADAEQTAGALAWLERAMDGNLERTLARDASGSTEIFFLHFALEALYRHGRVAAAERAIRQHYTPMHAAGSPTIWENLTCVRGTSHQLCQGWGATAAWWFQRQVLGVRQEAPGDPSRMLVAPDSALEWAEGCSPHPRGVVRVSWRRAGRRLELEASAPSGVRLRVAPGPSFAGLEVVANVRVD
jgi:hypothetical protein